MYRLSDWVEDQIARLPQPTNSLESYACGDLRFGIRQIHELLAALLSEDIEEQVRAARSLSGRIPRFLSAYPSSLPAWQEEVLPLLEYAERTCERWVRVPARQAIIAIRRAAVAAEARSGGR